MALNRSKRAALCLLAGLAWQAGFTAQAAPPARAAMAQPAGIMLSTGDVERFMASLPAMLAARARAAPDAGFHEHGDDPLMAFTDLEESAPVTDALAPVLAAHGFADLARWLAVGRALLEAYWSVRTDGRRAALAAQMAPLALALRGHERPTEREIADMTRDLRQRMIDRARARVPAANLGLAAKYEADITRRMQSLRAAPTGETR